MCAFRSDIAAGSITSPSGRGVGIRGCNFLNLTTR